MKIQNYTKWIGGLAVITAAVLWALDGILRESLQSLNPLTVVFVEHLIGSLIAIPVLVIFRKRLAQMTVRQRIAIVVVAALSGVLGTTLYVSALFEVAFANFSVVVLLQQLQPIFAISASAILLREKVSGQFIGLALLGMFGAYMLNFPEMSVNFDTGDGTFVAGLLAVGAAAAWGIGTALSKYTLKDTFWPQITALRFMLATVISGIALIFIPSRDDLHIITSDNVAQLMIIALSTGFVAVAIYYFGLQRIRASRATILELAFPLTAVLIGYFRFNNSLTNSQVIGAVILMFVSFYILKNEANLTSDSE